MEELEYTYHSSMARPRVFVSSTFYDLHHVRTELERFIHETMGYEAVLNERGNVTYGKDEKLEDYCYREIQNVDMLVNIVGSAFGSKSAQDDEHSISQMELRAARKLGKQVYVFVERNVRAEYDRVQFHS